MNNNSIQFMQFMSLQCDFWDQSVFFFKADFTNVCISQIQFKPLISRTVLTTRAHHSCPTLNSWLAALTCVVLSNQMIKWIVCMQDRYCCCFCFSGPLYRGKSYLGSYFMCYPNIFFSDRNHQLHLHAIFRFLTKIIK